MHRGDIDFDSIFPWWEEDGIVEPFFIKGDWSIHQILEPLNERIGSCSIDVSTFNIAEDALRSFLNLRDSRIRMLLDMGVRRHKLDLLLFASEITPDIRIDSCHSKIFLASSPRYRFGIVGSANLNTGNRYESGIWFTSGKFFDFFSDCFDKSFNEALPYDASGID